MEQETLVLDEFYISFAGTRYCLEFIFSRIDLSERFTNLMAEKYGDIISKEWFFYQKDVYNFPYIPHEGESKFSPERGYIAGLQRMLTNEEIKQAYDMILSVAKEMGITVLKRNTINLGKQVAYGEKPEYKFTTILTPEIGQQDIDKPESSIKQ